MPYAFFACGILLGLGLIVRRFWRLNSGLAELDRAEGLGKASPSVRRAWIVNRVVFVLGVLATIVITILALYGVDEILRG